mmetsp:Transcript_18648/g.31796  ORF Transcript_18648/g.31796 Transcript_18648/m.31796 type:complete len:244 (+) Transcript_18648:124-855(+)
MATRLSPYLVLGLASTASRGQVKDAFRKLCLQYHPDKVASGVDKRSAETRFRVIKSAYDEILKGQAGYAPPPPGSGASSNHARAWYKAQHGVEPEGPIRCGGPFGGYTTESDFYRAMGHSTRNNPFLLIVAGVFCIPVISMSVNAANGNLGWVRQFADEGIFMFTDNKFQINGRTAVRTNPYSIRADGEDSVHDSYIYKSEKYKHLRAAMETTSSAGAHGTHEAAPSSKSVGEPAAAPTPATT